MLDFSEITINDKELFDMYLRSFSPQASEMTFTNFFMWRNFYRFRYTQINGLLCVIGVPERKKPFCLAPLGKASKESFTDAVSKLKEYFLKNGWDLVFERIDEVQLQRFKEFLNVDSKNICLDRDNWDYVYLVEDLTTLKGKKYDGKRNHINKFKKSYSYSYETITQDNIHHCYDIMEKWCAERDCDDHRGYYCEKLANMELLQNFTSLECKGALIEVDGKYEAFTVGEALNSDTAVVHIEKASSGINGLYTFVNQQFCENQWGSFTYINREQDLGIEGLRKAKLSYQPVKLIDKYTVVI